MFKCNRCGDAFENPEVVNESHGLDGGFCESFAVCPNCGGDFSEAEMCQKCGAWDFSENIYGGYCFDCLSDEIDYQTGYEYLVSFENGLIDFVFEILVDIPTIQKADEKIDFLSSVLYWSAVSADKEEGGGEFLHKLKTFIIGGGDADIFAEWLNERGCQNADWND